MSDEKREIMRRHAAQWQPLIDSGQMVIFGPVLDSTGSWGLGVIEPDDEDELRALAARDPAVTSGTAQIEIGACSPGSCTRADPLAGSRRRAVQDQENARSCHAGDIRAFCQRRVMLGM